MAVPPSGTRQIGGKTYRFYAWAHTKKNAENTVETLQFKRDCYVRIIKTGDKYGIYTRGK